MGRELPEAPAKRNHRMKKQKRPSKLSVVATAITPNAGLSFNAYAILQRAVEEGIGYGLRRVTKYREEPIGEELERALAAHVESAVMSALCEVLNFGDDQ